MTNWNKYLASGIGVPPGAPTPVRKEINDLSSTEFYLYIEGLKKFQHTDPNDPLSWYQIAGIHGLPYTTWPNKLWNNDTPNAQNAGFCTHSSILFLTWHRPYLALFETALYKHVNDIAQGISSSSPDKAKYVADAKRFRMPYWDWARKDVSIFPRDALSNNTTARGPRSWASVQGTQGDYNPLFKFTFPEGTPRNITLGFRETRRWPNDRNSSNGLQRVLREFYSRPSKEMSGSVLNPERNLTERVAYILLAYQRFGSMSHNKFRATSRNRAESADNWGSLEDIHNAVHGLAGNGGQMGFPTTAAFDPIFWLHHTNIDRLFCIWQYLHQNENKAETYVTPQPNPEGSFSFRKGTLETPETKLYPFRDGPTTWYDSRKVKYTDEFGYEYPETAGLPATSTPASKRKLERAIKDYYTPLSRMIRRSRAGDRNAGADLLPQATLLKEIHRNNLLADTDQVRILSDRMLDKEALLETSLQRSKPFLRDLAPNNTYLEWLVNVKALKHAFDGALTVHVFLGPIEEDDVLLWPASPNHVGTFVTFGQGPDTRCGRCKEDQAEKMQVTGQIPLTLALVERYLAGILPDIRAGTVVPYLTRELHWRAARSDGTITHNRRNVDGLTVYVVSNEVTIPEDELQRPRYADDVVIWPQITTGRDGYGRGEGSGLTASEMPEGMAGYV